MIHTQNKRSQKTRSLVRWFAQALVCWLRKRSFVGCASVRSSRRRSWVARSLGVGAAFAPPFEFAQVAQRCAKSLSFAILEWTVLSSPTPLNLARQSILATHCLANLTCLAKFAPFANPNVSTRKVQKTKTQHMLRKVAQSGHSFLRAARDARISSERDTRACRSVVGCWRGVYSAF